MNKKTLQTRMLRHGEILVIPVESVPEGFHEAFKGKEYIVARSETHHHHIAVAEIAGALTVYKPVGADSTDLYLRVSAPAKIEHQKTHDRHKDIDLPKGVYLVRAKNEYDPFARLIQKVRD